MELGMVGLGRMGANMAQRLVRGGHVVGGFDPSPEARQRARTNGIAPADSLAALVAALPSPRVVWLMVPAGKIVDDTLDALLPLLSAGDIVVDGGNSYYKDSQRRAARLEEADIAFVDCGTSGGVWGLTEGYSMMIGGADAAMAHLQPLFETLAPSPTSGWGHVGPVGSGHFTKMVHNGIEYGMMQAYAEGFAILERKEAFALDLHQIAQVWQTGSVVRSWLLDITTDALKENPALAGIAPYVEDSGEGRWTVAESLDLNVSAPVITLSLLERLRSREKDSYADKLLAAMRNGFGGHKITKE
jgi:6-phosphogluconate dehydrogenase